MAVSILLDTNVLVLYAVGLASPGYIAAHRRLSAYRDFGAAAFAVLTERLSTASTLLVTPNIATETSNLLGARDRDDEVGLAILATFRSLLDLAEERPVPSREAAARPEFQRLGLADAATIDAIGDGAVLVTDDAPLYDAALRAGRQAELFSHHLVAAGLR